MRNIIKMKCCIYCLIVICLFFAGCSSNEEPKQIVATAENILQTEFLNLFEENTSDTLQIQSTTPEYISEMPDYKFLGKQIDKKFFALFSSTPIADTAKYYACVKQKLNDSTTLLIIRTPSVYWESSIKIYLFNSKLSKVIDVLEVADVDGDEISSNTKYANLIKSNTIFTLTKFSSKCAIDEESGGSECVDSVFFYNFENNQIKELKRMAKEVAKNV